MLRKWSNSSHRWIFLAFGLLIATGLIARLIYSVQGHSLWLDELKLALNIRDRTWIGLFQPLDHGQGAPPLFLLILKAAWEWLGNTDTSLLIPVYLVGILVLPAFYWCAQQGFKEEGTACALLLFVLNPQVFTYSFFLKQYIFDVFVSILLIGYFNRLSTKQSLPGNFDYLIALVIGALANWLSHPSVFVLAGLGSVFWLQLAMTRNWKHVAIFSVIICAWAGSFYIQYSLILQNLQTNEMLESYWNAGMLHTDTGPSGWVLWMKTVILNFAYIGTMPIALSSFLLLLSLYVSIRKPSYISSALWCIVFIATLASALGYYPLYDRLSLFLVPVIILLMTTGLLEVFRLLKSHTAQPIILLVCSGLLLSTFPALKRQLHNPGHFQELKQALTYISKQPLDHDRVLVTGDATTAFAFYSNSIGLKSENLMIAPTRSIVEYLPEILSETKGTFFVTGRIYKHGDNEAYQTFFKELRQAGRRFEIKEYLRAAVIHIQPNASHLNGDAETLGTAQK